jgi:DNA helicase-2/ATP-dependent DNA helicase PcrA
VEVIFAPRDLTTLYPSRSKPLLTFTPTAEQEAIRQAARNTKDNLIVHALAGAYKTSTLILIAKACMVPILSVAFNVRIAKEMTDRMPGNVTAKTLNSIGGQMWNNTRGRCALNKDKVYEICKELIDGLPKDQKSEGYAIMTDLMQAVRYGKTSGYVPKMFADMAKPLMTEEELFADLDEEPSPLLEELIIEASTRSMRMAFDRQIDYDDQILMPGVFPVSFSKFPLTLLDESQDFSLLNHVLLWKIIGDGRVIAVGDKFQAIYGFRGAHENSMDLLQEKFEMKRFELTECGRCPVSVVTEAQFRAPMMRPKPGAPEGTVRHLVQWDMAEFPPEATIICRNNAPLFRMAMLLLRNGRYPELVGADVGKALIKIMKKLGDQAMPIPMSIDALDMWKQTKLEKSRDPGRIHDQYECMLVFFEQAESLGGAIAYAERLLTTAGGIKLMTGHKAKGLEWDDVYILNRELINLHRGQDRNLLYVMQTRSKKNLTYLTLEGFKG